MRTEHTAAILRQSPWQPAEIMAPFGNKGDLGSPRNQRLQWFAVEVIFSDCFRLSLWTEKRNGQENFQKITRFADISCGDISHGGKQDSSFSSLVSTQGIPPQGCLLAVRSLGPVPATQNDYEQTLLAFVAIIDLAHFLIGGRNTSELMETEHISTQCHPQHVGNT